MSCREIYIEAPIQIPWRLLLAPCLAPIKAPSRPLSGLTSILPSPPPPFSNVDKRTLDVFTSTLATFHTALSKKQDVYIQDGLKYAFPTRFTRKEAQLHRRKENLSHLRHHLNHLAKVLLLHKPLIVHASLIS